MTDPFARVLASYTAPEVPGYELGEVLGEGAQARVYSARDVEGARVALKVLVDPSPEARERQHREGAALERVGSHPNLVGLRAGARDARGEPVLVLERIVGTTLAMHLASEGPLAPRAAARLARDLASGLAHAHERGVVHRDVKPANVLLEDGSGRPVLVDFGVARLAEATPLTRLGGRPGTPPYMPPERLRGEDATASTDVYGLGVLLYECLVGARPWEDDAGAYERSVRDPWGEVPAGARARVAIVPRRLRRLVAACVALDPAVRPLDARALADGLTRFLAETPLARARGRALLVATFALALLQTALPARSPALTPPPCVAARAALASGRARLAEGDAQGAVRELKEVLTLAPGDVDALVLRGRARLALSDARGTIDDCTAAIALDPGRAEAFHVRALAEYALARKDVGDMTRARRDVTRALELDPTDPDAFCLRGFTRHFLGDSRGAIEDHTRALVLRPGDRRALLNRGAVLHEVGDHAGALRDLDQVVADDPSALLFRGRARLALGDLEGAFTDWSTFVARFPDELDATTLHPQLAALRERIAGR